MALEKPVGLMSAERLTTLVTAVLVALSSGTNYVYSAYAPQLGARLKITHTQLNIIAIAGNIGVYSTGPLWGRIVDRRGPHILMFSGFFLLLVGYSGIRFFYDRGLPEGSTTLSATSFYTLILCGYMSGAGGNGGLTGGLNATAKSFPERARATTLGVVLSGFGLSAFFFSTLAREAFPGDTSSFLLILAWGTALPMIAGFFFIKPVSLPASELRREVENDDESDNTLFQHPGVSSQTHLLVHEPEEPQETVFLSDSEQEEEALIGAQEHRRDQPTQDSQDVELSPARSRSPDDSIVPRNRSRSAVSSRSLGSLARRMLHHDGPNVFGAALWKSGDFWLLFFTLTILSGTGLMYINNVGSMAQALIAASDVPYSEVEASAWQTAQVSVISLMNFSGRILMGLLSDAVRNRLGRPRSFCLVLVSSAFLVSQIVATSVNDIRNLWKASVLLGISYGSVFALMPTIVIDWFGMPHFSENWGFLSLSPMIGGNVFSVAFGRNLDAHEPQTSKSSSMISRAANALIPRGGIPSASSCTLGRACYVDTLHWTVAACALSVGLSIWAAWRDQKKRNVSKTGLERGTDNV